jgi:hypothetical protein
MAEPVIDRHIFGDSNIIRYLPKLQESKSDPSIKAVSMTKATNSVLLRDALSNPKSAYPIVIIAALTNLITAKFFEDYDLMVEHCKSAFNDVLLWIQEGRDNLDGFAALVSYPTLHEFGIVAENWSACTSCLFSYAVPLSALYLWFLG